MAGGKKVTKDEDKSYGCGGKAGTSGKATRMGLEITYAQWRQTILKEDNHHDLHLGYCLYYGVLLN